MTQEDTPTGSNIHVTVTHYLGRYLAPTYNEGDRTVVKVCEYLLAGKFGQIFLRDSQS